MRVEGSERERQTPEGERRRETGRETGTETERERHGHTIAHGLEGLVSPV